MLLDRGVVARRLLLHLVFFLMPVVLAGLYVMRHVRFKPESSVPTPVVSPACT